MRKFVLPGVIVVAAVAALALLAFGVSRNNDTSSIDAKVARGAFPIAPSYRMPLEMLESSRHVSLASYRGKVVVLNVFASWCADCATEAPLLAREQKLLAAHNATLLGVTYEDAAPSTVSFDNNYHVDYPVVRDVNGDFVRSFGTDAVPETFVINRQGKVQAVRREPVTAQWFRQTLPKILAGQA
jgi:cytochrome c biogenesis protein CcmG, thiol:disulfide interchange protein DsbE